MLKFIDVETTEKIEIIRNLFLEYEKIIGCNLCFQDIENELANLPGKYSPPDGRLILAEYDSKLAGCIALKKIGDDICEMKRLYVRSEFRGKKIGRKLAEKIVEEARSTGYRIMRLDTLKRLHEAVSLYKSMGFIETHPYVHNPLEDVIFMELNL
jgi:GNAT superfamily N-acetyltransferase